jgi:hypothetical protein
MLIKIGGRWLCWAIVVIFISGMRPILIGPLVRDQMGVDIILGIIRVSWVGIGRIGRIIVLIAGMLLSWGHKTYFKTLVPRNSKH